LTATSGRSAGQGHGLAERQADHHPAHQAGPGGGGHAVQGVEADPRRAHRLGGHAIDGLDMGAGGDLGHHPAERGVLLELGADDRGQDLDAAVLVPAHDGRGGLVAAGFEAEDREGRFRKGRHAVAGFPPLL
jgi:hypothetical protein